MFSDKLAKRMGLANALRAGLRFVLNRWFKRHLGPCVWFGLCRICKMQALLLRAVLNLRARDIDEVSAVFASRLVKSYRSE
jgi:hypothetical protein